MTQSAESPAGDRSPDDLDAGPAAAPPPDSWHFPPGVTQQHQAQPAAASAPPDNGGPSQNGAPQYAPPYGTSPHYGTPQPHGIPYPPYAASLPAGPEPDLAEWWRRLLGRLIDILVLTVLAAPIALAVLSHSFSQYQRIIDRYPDSERTRSAGGDRQGGREAARRVAGLRVHRRRALVLLRFHPARPVGPDARQAGAGHPGGLGG